jgi:hypothetical protein
MGGQARFVLVVAAVLLVVAATWTWLPPSDDSRAAIEETLATYESLDAVVWPPDLYDDPTLSSEQQDLLLSAREDAWREVAEGDALTRALQQDPRAVRRAAAERRRSPHASFVTDAGGDVVVFDFRRRTFGGEILVRAVVVGWVEKGSWSMRADALVDVYRDEAGGGPVLTYTLRQRGDVWKVVDADVPDGPPYFYDAETGEYGTGP